MDHDRGTETGLIGEDASLHTPCHSKSDTVACDAAADCLHREGSADNGGKNSTQLADIGKEHDQRTDDIGDRHKGHELLRDRCDALEAADDDQGRQDHQEDTGDIYRDPENLLQVCSDGVDLTHVADTKRGKHAKGAEQDCEHCTDPLAALFGAQTVVKIVHGTSAPLSDFVFTAVIDTQHIFREISHHAKEGHDPHPEDSSRAARDDSRRDAGDIARADRGRKGGAKTLKLADGLVVLCRVCCDMLVSKNRADRL